MEIPYQIHVHHEKKLKDYIFDFFMLFMAVTLGFFVENKRDHFLDRQREKEYIRSLLVDLREDTTKVNQTLSANNYYIETWVDTLVHTLQAYKPGDTAATRKLYQLYMSCARGSYTVKFTDRTISTLKTSGNLRIIQTQSVADSILRYDEDCRTANAQATTYNDFWMRSLDLSCLIFDYKYISHKRDPITNAFTFETQSSYTLLNEDPDLLRRYANLLELWRQVNYGYALNIYTAKLRAAALIPFLKREYDLE